MSLCWTQQGPKARLRPLPTAVSSQSQVAHDEVIGADWYLCVALF